MGRAEEGAKECRQPLDAEKEVLPPAPRRNPERINPCCLSHLFVGPGAAAAGPWLRGDWVSPASALPEPRPPPTVRCDGPGGLGLQEARPPATSLAVVGHDGFHFCSSPARAPRPAHLSTSGLGRRDCVSCALGLRSLRGKQTTGACLPPRRALWPQGTLGKQLTRRGHHCQSPAALKHVEFPPQS